MNPEYVMLKIENIIKNIFVGFVVGSISLAVVGGIIFYVAIMISFNNVFLSLFMFGLLLVIYYIGKQVRLALNDSEQQ